MEKYDVVIIGGGASGCYLAMHLNKKLKVAVIDKNTTLAKKLLVTGNGKCNLTNKNVSSKYYNQNIDTFLERYSYNQTANFFSSIGIETYCDESGMCYPITNSAKSVVKAINNQLKHVRFFNETEFDNITKTQYGYVVETNINQIEAKAVVFATGNNQILEDLKQFNIQFKQFVPSLVALKTKQNTKVLDGVRVSNVKVTASCCKSVKTDYGEILFKDNGLSGICIFNLSCLFARNNNFDGKVIVDLLPQFTLEYTKKLILKNSKIFDSEEILTGIVDEKIAKYLLKNVKNENLANIIHNLEFDIKSCYQNNQVCSGGINLTELTENLESKRNNNLYFIGEICDVDGECGGFNLQWAWTSAKIVADDINKKTY